MNYTHKKIPARSWHSQRRAHTYKPLTSYHKQTNPSSIIRTNCRPRTPLWRAAAGFGKGIDMNNTLICDVCGKKIGTEEGDDHYYDFFGDIVCDECEIAYIMKNIYRFCPDSTEEAI